MTPEVAELPMLVVATIGLAVNLVVFGLLRQGAKESLNVEGAYLEVVADTLGSVGVIVAAIAVASNRLVVDRSGRRRRDRPVDPAAHLAPRSPGGAHPRPVVAADVDLARLEGDLLALPDVVESTTSTCGR